MHQNSIFLFKKYGVSFFNNNKEVLEIGPDSFPSTYQKIIGNAFKKWETIDIQNSNCQKDFNVLSYVSKSEHSFPIPANSFDIILSGQVIEHVRKPWIWYRELGRILRPGGFIITIAPVSWPYHPAPLDCQRIFPDGFEALHEEAKLKTIFIHMEYTEKKRELVPHGMYLIRQGIKMIFGKIANLKQYVEPTIDVIAISQKPFSQTTQSLGV